MGKILLRNITLDGCAKDVAIADGLIHRIVRVGSFVDGAFMSGAEIMDCSGKHAIPGFVNSHTHAAMSLVRGIGEDIDFAEWIKRIWKAEERIDSEFIYWGTKVACLEMISTGTTLFSDHYWYPSTARKAASEMGLNMGCAYVFLDNFDKEKIEIQREECQKLQEESLSWGDSATFVVGLHSVYSVSEEQLVWASEFARKHGARIHIHVSETEKEVSDCKAAHGGLSPVEYLDRLGVLGPDTIAAHTLWLSEKDISILGERRVNCVHNVNSNLKLSSGFRFLYNELKQAGANLCIGTDGCASSNNLDILEAMKTSAMIQKAWRKDPAAMHVSDLLDMATVNGARALGINSGVLAEGFRADMSIIDTNSSYFMSKAPFEANLIYSANSGCIDSLICGGRFLMKNRVIPDSGFILDEARKVLYEK